MKRMKMTAKISQIYELGGGVLMGDNGEVVDVSLEGNKFVSLDPIVGFEQLESLNVDDTLIRDLSPLSQFHDLRELRLSGLSNMRLDAVGRLRLRVLWLSFSDVEDVQPIENVESLRELTFFVCPRLQQLPNMSKMTELEDLGIVNTPRLSDIRRISSARKVRDLALQLEQDIDYSPIATLTDLRQLSVYRSSIECVAPIANCLDLEVLSLERSQRVSDIAPLGALTRLTKLSLDYTSVADVSPLIRMQHLENLRLMETRVASLTPLHGLDKLTFLDIRYTPVNENDAEVLAFQRAVPGCRVLRADPPWKPPQ